MASQLATRFGKQPNSFSNNQPIPDEIIQQVAPSIFATEPHESRSERYRFYSTHEVLTALRAEGFEPFMVGQGRSRIEGKENYTKHIMRLRHRSIEKTDGGAFEILIINSHDGTSRYQLMSGWLEFVCMNGLVKGDIAADIRIRHSGKVIDNIIEGAYTVLQDAAMIADQRAELNAIPLNQKEREMFATVAMNYRWSPDEETGAPTAPPVTVDQVLHPRRASSAGNSAWRTFNQVQEALVERGGIPYATPTGRSMSTRAVSGIAENVKLNRALWQLTQGMAALKAEGIEAMQQAMTEELSKAA